jgi:hypothetical protein
MGTYRGYDDKWILEHLSEYTSWKNLFDTYFSTFHFGTYRNFRNHLYNDLGLTRKFTEEQNNWIIKNYPVLGAKKATEEFNKIFPVGRSRSTIVSQAFKLGVQVNGDVAASLQKSCSEKLPIGSSVIRYSKKDGRKSPKATVWVKLETGEWVRESYAAVGKIEKHQRVIHLDGDTFNNSKDNLEVVDMKTLSKMSAYKMWSEDPTITKTGIMCVQLENLLE